MRKEAHRSDGNKEMAMVWPELGKMITGRYEKYWIGHQQRPKETQRFQEMRRWHKCTGERTKTIWKQLGETYIFDNKWNKEEDGKQKWENVEEMIADSCISI